MKHCGTGEPVHRIQKLFLEAITHHQSSHLHSLSPSRPPQGLQEKKTSVPPWWYCQVEIADVE